MICCSHHKYFPLPAPGAVLAAAHGAAQAAAGGAGGGGDRAPGLQVPGVRHAGQQGRVQHVSRYQSCHVSLMPRVRVSRAATGRPTPRATPPTSSSTSTSPAAGRPTTGPTGAWPPRVR